MWGDFERIGEDRMKTLVAMAALAALIASPALAQTATQRARAQQYQSQVNQVQSSDRAIGHERTCGFAEYQYDSEGTPVGPYCH
jgi:opacity protein-like surface antigen